MHHDFILFDLDGTLLDTLEDIADAGNAAFARFGLPLPGLADYRAAVGWGMEELMRRLTPEGADLAAVTQAMREEYPRFLDKKTKPYAGMPEALDAMTAAGARVAVVSNKPHELAVTAVADHFPAVPFVGVLGARASMPLKPEPDMALALMELAGAAPGRTALVGDTGIDMATARAAQITPVGVSWGFRTTAMLREAGALLVVDHPLELPGVL